MYAVNYCRVLLLIMALSGTFWGVLIGQQSGPHQPGTVTFDSPDGTFRFNYSRALVSCQKSTSQSDLWLPENSCNAYTPVCSNYSCDSSGTLACIAYPANEMKGSNFEAAAFSVSELKQAGSEAECLKVDEPPPHAGRPQVETVNGVKFEVTETDGVAAGNLMEGYVYRAFHKGRCYELDIRIAYWNSAYADPGAVKDFDMKAVHDRLKRVLGTFKFVH